MISFIIPLLVSISAISAMTVEEAHKNIQASLPVSLGASLCSGIGSYPCCNLTSTQRCPISGMSRDVASLVFPGGATRCIYSTSTPFAFEIIPGDTDKLLFYFQGGGACWDEGSTASGECTSDTTPQKEVGIFDRVNVKNKFRSYTVVHVSYCSGDLFGGDVIRSYKDAAGVPVTQKGLANAQSALDWVQQEQVAGRLAASFSDLVVSGCSAGSIGAQVWGNQVISTLKYKTASVVPDSYAGIFPPNTQGPLIQGFGMCSAYFLSSTLRAQCLAGTLTLQDIDSDFMFAKPYIPYAFIQSKTDIVQESFYVMVGKSFNSTSAITPAQFYKNVIDVFGTYNKQHPNFLSYLVDGDMHCFSPDVTWFTADAKGPEDNNRTNTGPMMAEWANKYSLQSFQQASSVCEGALGNGVGAGADNTYCSSTIIPKTFTEVY